MYLLHETKTLEKKEMKVICKTVDPDLEATKNFVKSGEAFDTVK